MRSQARLTSWLADQVLSLACHHGSKPPKLVAEALCSTSSGIDAASSAPRARPTPAISELSQLRHEVLCRRGAVAALRAELIQFLENQRLVVGNADLREVAHSAGCGTDTLQAAEPRLEGSPVAAHRASTLAEARESDSHLDLAMEKLRAAVPSQEGSPAAAPAATALAEACELDIVQDLAMESQMHCFHADGSEEFVDLRRQSRMALMLMTPLAI